MAKSEASERFFFGVYDDLFKIEFNLSCLVKLNICAIRFFSSLVKLNTREMQKNRGSQKFVAAKLNTFKVSGPFKYTLTHEAQNFNKHSGVLSSCFGICLVNGQKILKY